MWFYYIASLSLQILLCSDLFLNTTYQHIKTSQETKNIKIWTSINKSQVIQAYDLSFVQEITQLPQAHLHKWTTKTWTFMASFVIFKYASLLCPTEVFSPFICQTLMVSSSTFYTNVLHYCCKWIRINFLFLNNSVQKYQEEGCGTKYPITVWYPAFQRV